MIYFVKNPPIKLGKWEIIAHWSMDVVATFYNQDLADRIVKILNKEDEEIQRKHDMERFYPEI